MRQRLQAVDEESENFMNKLDTRRKNISMAMSFFGLAETVSNLLDTHRDNIMNKLDTYSDIYEHTIHTTL